MNRATLYSEEYEQPASRWARIVSAFRHPVEYHYHALIPHRSQNPYQPKILAYLSMRLVSSTRREIYQAIGVSGKDARLQADSALQVMYKKREIRRVGRQGVYRFMAVKTEDRQ